MGAAGYCRAEQAGEACHTAVWHSTPSPVSITYRAVNRCCCVWVCLRCSIGPISQTVSHVCCGGGGAGAACPGRCRGRRRRRLGGCLLGPPPGWCRGRSCLSSAGLRSCLLRLCRRQDPHHHLVLRVGGDCGDAAGSGSDAPLAGKGGACSTPSAAAAALGASSAGSGGGRDDEGEGAVGMGAGAAGCCCACCVAAAGRGLGSSSSLSLSCSKYSAAAGGSAGTAAAVEAGGGWAATPDTLPLPCCKSCGCGGCNGCAAGCQLAMPAAEAGVAPCCCWSTSRVDVEAAGRALLDMSDVAWSGLMEGWGACCGGCCEGWASW